VGVQARGKLAIKIQRPVLFRAARERVKDREVSHRDGGNADARRGGDLDRQGWEERERETANGVAKLGAIGAVPGIDRVERFKFGDASAVDNSKKIEAGIGDGADTIGELNERENGPRRPNLGVFGACRFEFGEGEDAIADGAGTDQETTHVRPGQR